LQASYPSLEKITRERNYQNNYAYKLSAAEMLEDASYPALWREFFEFHTSPAYHAELARVWGDAIRKEHPTLEQRIGAPFAAASAGRRSPVKAKRSAYDIVYDCQFVINSPVRAESSVRPPHVDSVHTLIAALVYFRAPQDDSRGGDLELYRLADPNARYDQKRQVEPRLLTHFKTVPYAANRMVMWINSPRSLHGVTPRSVTEHTRQYVNVIGECYAIGAQGLFTLPGATPEGQHQRERGLGGRIAAAFARRK
jgi:hypothetical protein